MRRGRGCTTIDSKDDVLVWGPMYGSLMQSLEKNFNVHKRWEIADFVRWAIAQRDDILVIRLSNTSEVLNNSVAETALALILRVSRRISEAERFVRAGKWQQGKFSLGNFIEAAVNPCLAT